VVDEKWNSKILINLPVTNISRCIRCNMKTHGLQHLQLPDMAMSRGPPDQAFIALHRMLEFLMKQHTISDRQETSIIKEAT
jgi:hypothetical protein